MDRGGPYLYTGSKYRAISRARENMQFKKVKKEIIKGVLHPRPVFGLFLHFSQKLQHIGDK